ncbi:TPA: hypothetical protein WHZ05_002037 [Neisseria meningitidis]
MFGGRLKNAPSITAKHFLKENIMKFINTCRKYGAKLAVVTAAPLALAAHANATLPDTAKNALEAAKADGMEAGWIVVGVFAALFVFFIVKRVMK